MNSPKSIARVAGILYLLLIGVRTVKPVVHAPDTVCGLPDTNNLDSSLHPTTNDQRN